MYSTIQEAWNNDITDVYTENFKQNKFKTISSSNNFFNIHEDYGSIKGVRTNNTSTSPSQVNTKKKKNKKNKKNKKKLPTTSSIQSSQSDITFGRALRTKGSNPNSTSTQRVRNKSSTVGNLRSTVGNLRSTTTSNPKIRSIKSKLKCNDIFKHIKKCKKCRKKLEKYINRNKIVIDMNPVEVRKMLLCLIMIGMFIMLFNMITERRIQKQ